MCNFPKADGILMESNIGLKTWLRSPRANVILQILFTWKVESSNISDIPRILFAKFFMSFKFF